MVLAKHGTCCCAVQYCCGVIAICAVAASAALSPVCKPEHGRLCSLSRLAAEAGEDVGSSTGSSDDSLGEELRAEVWECVVCDKVFKSEGAKRNHEASKAHQKALTELKAQLQR